jgi:hypothetical protein
MFLRKKFEKMLSTEENETRKQKKLRKRVVMMFFFKCKPCRVGLDRRKERNRHRRRG